LKYLPIIPHFWKFTFFTFHQNREYCFIFNEFFFADCSGDLLLLFW
jgi:hypothetical protein